MSSFIPWDSQSLETWASQHAAGKFIDLDGHSTHYIEKGAGEPIVLVHGFFYDSFTWSKNLDVLADGFKVYALDLWGFGYSTREPMDYGYPLYAGQLLKFMDTLGIQKASLVGHSMGGGTSIFFTVRHRDRVDKLILVDSAGMPNPLPLLGRIANLPGIGEFMYGLNSNLFRRMALSTNWIYDREFLTDTYFENVTRFHKIKGTTEVMLTILRKQFFHTLAHEVRHLSEMGVPILIVWGRHDKAVPLERGQEMHRILSQSRLEILEHVGHCPQDEQSQIFNRLVLDFLSSTQEVS
jgi:pimeloyl-ACP methyl ester carboxylesterase